MADLRIGIIGYGKIARDQHVPAIAGDPHFTLCGVVAPGGAPDAPVPVFADHNALIAAGGIDAVAICTPAAPRYAIACDCIGAGVHALLEKPPTSTLAEVDQLAAMAQQRDVSLFTTWHAQHNSGVERLRSLITAEGLRSMGITWLEDVEKWHPGQQWIWQPGGFGVFDAGINALSIATFVAPVPLIVAAATFTLQAEGQQPIAAELEMRAAGMEAAISGRFDWRHSGEERWDIEGETAAGTRFLLSNGGATLSINGTVQSDGGDSGEYPNIYATFARLIAERQSLVDSAPLRLLADANLIARRLSAAGGSA